MWVLLNSFDAEAVDTARTTMLKQRRRRKRN
jgi:hypothetical protein